MLSVRMTLALAAGLGLASGLLHSKAPRPIPPKRFDNRSRMIRVQPDEQRFWQVPWKFTISETREEAAKEARTADDVGKLVVAYEPIWAIGTGRTASAEDAQEMCAAVRDQVTQTFGAEAGLRIRVQYGGSAKANNAAELLSQPDIDGLLVGGASLDPVEFAKIVQSAGQAI